MRFRKISYAFLLGHDIDGVCVFGFDRVVAGTLVLILVFTNVICEAPV